MTEHYTPTSLREFARRWANTRSIMHTQEAHITRNPNGWSIHTIQTWDNFPGKHETHKGAATLGFAIFEVAYWCSKNDTRLTILTVNGQPMPKDKAIAAVKSRKMGWMEAPAIAVLKQYYQNTRAG